MLIADTSVWIEFLRGSGSPHVRRMRQALSDREIIVIDPILLEVMSGVVADAVGPTQRLLEAQQLEAVFPKLDWLDAASIYRELRWRGVTIRPQIDVLIAAVAIRLDVPVLHHDRDYEHITQHTALRTIET